jgi:hypothetical protein
MSRRATAVTPPMQRLRICSECGERALFSYDNTGTWCEDCVLNASYRAWGMDREHAFRFYMAGECRPEPADPWAV